jgi:hypothetical protein
MTNDQAVHIGMLNSFNLITEVATYEQIMDADMGIFAHNPEDDIEYDNIKFIMLYFEQFEMFEHCAELKKYIDLNFNSDGSRKETDCECDMPEIKEYTLKMKCFKCDKRLRR